MMRQLDIAVSRALLDFSSCSSRNPAIFANPAKIRLWQKFSPDLQNVTAV